MVFLIAALLISLGIFILIIGVFGIFKIHYIMNRLHSAAMLDSLGLFLIAAGAMLIYGFSFETLKLFMIVILFWVASPVCSHLLTNLEYYTNPELDDECRIAPLEEIFPDNGEES